MGIRLEVKNDQKQALEKLSKLRAGALFMQPGTGKTKVAFDLIRCKIGHFDVIIWIAPASLIKDTSYQDEIKLRSQALYEKISFFSIEGIGASNKIYLKCINLAQNNRVFCVVDESITIKNTDAKRTKRLIENYHFFDFRLILNGTPISKGLIDLYSQIQFISPNILKMNEAQFANNFLVYMNTGYKSWNRWSKPANEQALIEKIKPYIFESKLLLDVAINQNKKEFKLNESEMLAYQDFKEETLQNSMKPDFLKVSQKFQNFYTGKISEKNDELLKVLKDIKSRNEKALIFVKFLSEIEAIKELGIDFAEYSGKKKEDIYSKDIIVLTYGTGSLGLNLQHINNVIFFSLTFDYKQIIQGLHRCYRTGQEKTVNVFLFIAKTKLDSIMEKSLEKKIKVSENIISIIDSKPTPSSD